MQAFSGDDLQQNLRRVVVTEGGQAGGSVPSGRFEGDRFSTARHFNASLPKQHQQLVEAGGALGEGLVDGLPQRRPLGRFCILAPPLVVTLAMPLRVLDDGVTVALVLPIISVKIRFVTLFWNASGQLMSISETMWTDFKRNGWNSGKK